MVFSLINGPGLGDSGKPSDTLKVGDPLDMFIAVKIMKLIKGPIATFRKRVLTNDAGHKVLCPPFSTNIGAAIAVVMEFHKHGYEFNLSLGRVAIARFTKKEQVWVAQELTQAGNELPPATAICRAALKVAGL